MSSEAPSFAEEASNIMLKELQSWWEIPSMAQYISLFRESFNLPEVEIEELENGFIDDTIKGPNEWLRNLIIAFLRSILPARINVENFELHLRKLIRRKWSESPFSEKENPLEEDKPFHELSLRSKVEVFYCFCLYRLDKNDIAEQMKSMDAEALRVQKLGSDDVGNTYWYFYGTRLYKEDASDENKPWDEEWKEQKRNSLKKKRGRGRPRKRPRSDGESDYEDLQDTSRKSEFMNVDEKSRWSVVCDTIEEWVSFAEKFKNSKSKTEKSLFQIIQENFLPTLNKIYEEKERKLQEKIRELMPVREKIVTRRETRRLRGEPVDYAALNGGYYSDEEVKSTPVIKDRAQRLEERNKRASEAENVQIIFPHKKVKHDKSNSESENSNSSIHEKSESSSDIDVQSQMEKLLTSVKLHKDAWPFLYPVDEDDAPGYYEIIKDPIDLSRIENRLFKGEYETVGDLDEDFSKMVSNCELYNGEYHPYSKMAQTLRKVFRKEVARLLDSLEATENVSADSEGSNDSQYHSSSNSVSPHHESSPPPTVVTTPKERKKSKVGSKKKKRTTEALELLAQASDLAVQNSNSNDMQNISNIYDEQKKCSEFPNLKILPIHSHPPSFVEKYSNTSKESPRENDINYDTDSLYQNQKTDVDGQFSRSSPSDSAISTSSESTNYMHNLAHLASFIDKDTVKNLNILSNTDMANVITDGDASDSSSINELSRFSKDAGTSDNLHGLDNILDEYPENFISHLMKQPVYTTENQLSQSKDNCSPPYIENLSKQDDTLIKTARKSPSFSGHSVSNDISQFQDNANLQYRIGSPSNNFTTVDASVLGISLNTLTKKSRNACGPVSENQATFVNSEKVAPILSQEDTFSKNCHSLRLKQKTPPNEINQYYESSNLLNYELSANTSTTSYQSFNADIANSSSNPSMFIQANASIPHQIPIQNSKDIQQQSKIQMHTPNNSIQHSSNLFNYQHPSTIPVTSYQPLNLGAMTTSRNVPTTFISSLTTNSNSTMPLQIPAVYPKAVHPQANMQMQSPNNAQVPLPPSNDHLMFVPEANKGSAITYHVYTQNKPNQNLNQDHANNLANGSTAAIQMATNVEKRIINQDNANRTSPPEKKSPIPQDTRSAPVYVPSSMPSVSSTSSSSPETNKASVPVINSSFASVNSVVPRVKKNKPVIIRTKALEPDKQTSINNVSSTSLNTISNENINNTLHQSNIYQSFKPKTVPVVLSGYNTATSPNQSDLGIKNNPVSTVTMQSNNMCMSNGLPVVQQVLFPAGAQQIQMQNNGQFVLASPQNTVRLFGKGQNVQIQNNLGQLNQGFTKVMPQIITSSPIMQVSKDGMQSLQFQALPQNSTQSFTQVGQNPQFVNIPYMFANQNSVNNTPSQPVVNFQHYQLTSRQMQINDQGNS